MANAQTQPAARTPGEPGLERRLGPIAVSLSGIGIILGAGIYVLVGEAAGEAGSIRGVPAIATLGLAGNLGLAAYMDRDAFVAGLILLTIGLLASIYVVHHERQVAA